MHTNVHIIVCNVCVGQIEGQGKQVQARNLLRRHIRVFEDPNAVTVEDFRGVEQRYVTIGMDAFGRILVVVYMWRGDNIRIISARKAVRYEVRQYEGEI